MPLVKIPGILKQAAVRILRIAILTVLGLLIYIRIFEKRLVYYPSRELAGHPHSPYEDVFFPASDGQKLHGWFIPRPSSPAVLIVNHGNAGNISDRYEMGEYLASELDVNVFMYDYRGYGKSEGQPSEAGTYSDIRGAYSYALTRGFSTKQIFVFGQSLGTAVAVDLAAEQPVAGLILEAPFTSVRAVARHVARGVPLDYAMATRYDSLAKVHALRMPVAVVHAKGDPVIPFVMGVDLYQQLPGPKKFFEVTGELHEGAVMGLGLERTKELKAFLFSQGK